MNTILSQLRHNRAVFEAGVPVSTAISTPENVREVQREFATPTAFTPVSRAVMPIQSGSSDGYVRSFSLDYPHESMARVSAGDISQDTTVSYPQTQERASASEPDPMDGLVRRLEAQSRTRSQLLGENEEDAP